MYPGMFEKLRRFALSAMAVMVAGIGPATSGAVLFAPSAASAVVQAGNNGTIKIHEQGTPSGTESNDPKVCTFNVEGFGFDVGQEGYLNFDVQGGDGPTGVDAGPYVFGPTDSSGYYATEYFHLQSGHYKATLYGKDIAGQIDLKDVKAKSKVFKVTCDLPVSSVGSTTAAVSCQLGGLLIHFSNDSATAVAEWKVNGSVVTPDGSGNYLYPVAEDQAYDVTVTADGNAAGHYSGIRDCVLGASIVPANPHTNILASCGSADVYSSNDVNPGETGTAYTETITAPGSNEGTQTVFVEPSSTGAFTTTHFTYNEDIGTKTITVTVGSTVIATKDVQTDCASNPHANIITAVCGLATVFVSNDAPAGNPTGGKSIDYEIVASGTLTLGNASEVFTLQPGEVSPAYNYVFAEDSANAHVQVFADGVAIDSGKAILTDCAPAPVKKVDICHLTGSATNPYELLSIDVDALPAHILHGDVLAVDGLCPAGGRGGDEDPGTLIVIKHVINNDNGTKTAADFTMNVDGTDVSNSSFAGSEAGVAVTLTAGEYSVDEGGHAGYTETLSDSCSGTIAAGETVTCTITNNDNTVVTTPGGDTIGGDGNGQVLGDSITPPVTPVTPAGSVLGAATLPVTGGNSGFALFFALGGGAIAYWFSRRSILKSN